MEKLPSRAECERIIKPLLNKGRFYHSRCVADEAIKLAKLYGANEKKAEIAGILHDITKNMPESEQLSIIEASEIEIKSLRNALGGRKSRLWHAISGAVYVRDVVGISDADVFGAIRWHTSGRANMTLLEKVIFIADFTSADRDYEDVGEMRKLAQESLELAIIKGIRFTINELMEMEEYVISDSIETYNDAVLLLLQGKEHRPV